MRLFIAPRAGFWSCTANNWGAFIRVLDADDAAADAATEPWPELLPAREGRRAPLYVRLALEAAAQACRENLVPMDVVASVFASTVGDAHITDYMCQALATTTPVLSPTRFHNSVHNSASGYWSIAAGNRQPSSAVAAGRYTFAAALLEAALLATQEQRTVVMVVHDVAASGPMTEVCNLQEPFAAALLLSPRQEAADWIAVTLDATPQTADWPVPHSPWLAHLACANDSALGVALLEAMAQQRKIRLLLPLGTASSLAINAA
jgi:hypothetical protein